MPLRFPVLSGLMVAGLFGAAGYALHNAPAPVSPAPGPVLPAHAACVSVLSPDTQAITVNSGADIHAPACAVIVASTARPAAIVNAGTTLDTAGICIASHQVISHSTGLPAPDLGCTTPAPSPKISAPAVGPCTVSHQAYDGTDITLRPGTYCGSVSFNNAQARVTFEPGLYVIKGGDWTVDGSTWSGRDVTFYFADSSKIQFNSGVSVDLSAPASGPYARVLMFEAPGLSPSPVIFNDARAMHLDGAVWLPSRDTTFNSGSKLDSDGLMLGVRSLRLDQTMWHIRPLS